jgi:hypothetical protein
MVAGWATKIQHKNLLQGQFTPHVHRDHTKNTTLTMNAWRPKPCAPVVTSNTYTTIL